MKNNKPLYDKNKYLIEIKPLIYRNEIDRYGFSSLLSNIFKIKNIPKSYASWNHGWIWGPVDKPNYNFPGENLKKTNIQHIVHKPILAKQLKDHGILNVKLGKLPFAFTNYSGKKRIENSLLVIMQHIGEDLTAKEMNFIKYILILKKYFKTVNFCIYEDIDSIAKNLNIIKICENNNINYLVGAVKEDKNCLLRLRQIYDMHETMFTNGMGSHVLYAAYSGCKIAVARPPYYEDFVDSKDERTRFLYAYENIKLWMPNFFVDKPQEAILHYEWAYEEIGAKYHLNDDEIKDLLGWSIKGKIIAFFRYIQRIFY